MFCIIKYLNNSLLFPVYPDFLLSSRATNCFWAEFAHLAGPARVQTQAESQPGTLPGYGPERSSPCVTCLCTRARALCSLAPPPPALGHRDSCIAPIPSAHRHLQRHRQGERSTTARGEHGKRETMALFPLPRVLLTVQPCSRASLSAAVHESAPSPACRRPLRNTERYPGQLAPMCRHPSLCSAPPPLPDEIPAATVSLRHG